MCALTIQNVSTYHTVHCVCALTKFQGLWNTDSSKDNFNHCL